MVVRGVAAATTSWVRFTCVHVAVSLYSEYHISYVVSLLCDEAESVSS